MSERIIVLPHVTLGSGETYLLHTKSGARHLLGCTTDNGSYAARIGPDSSVNVSALFYAYAVVVAPNYLGKPANINQGPVRLGARARLDTLGNDEWWTSSRVDRIEALHPIMTRDEFEAIAEQIAEGDGDGDPQDPRREPGRSVAEAPGVVASRGTRHSLSEVCERLGVDEQAVRDRAREVADEQGRP